MLKLGTKMYICPHHCTKAYIPTHILHNTMRQAGATHLIQFTLIQCKEEKKRNCVVEVQLFKLYWCVVALVLLGHGL